VDFREFNTGEVRRTPLLGTWVNKGEKGGPGLQSEPRPLCVRALLLSAESLDDRLHLVVIVGAQRSRPEVASRG
jgi:hypothetical protein